MEKRTYNLYMRDTLFDPNDPAASLEKKALYKKYSAPEAKILYKVWLYLGGRDLPFVESVRYHLHSSFPNPKQVVERRMGNPNCAFAIWAWGMFNVKAEVFLMGGEILVINHFLTFGSEIELESEIRWAMQPSGSTQANIRPSSGV
ncbi:MAG: pYEATS domain-containing protein [Saprospiraceae bacterium]